MPEIRCTAGIAIVEDERELVRIYKIVFARQNIPVCFVAYDGHEAVELFEKANPRPGIVIMDHRLPTMTGIEAMKKILKIEPGVKIIFLSADDDVKEEAYKAGVKAFIKKPASIKQITATVENVLKNEDHPC